MSHSIRMMNDQYLRPFEQRKYVMFKIAIDMFDKKKYICKMLTSSLPSFGGLFLLRFGSLFFWDAADLRFPILLKFFPSIDLFIYQIIRFSGTDVSNVHFSNELLEMEGISQRQFINSPVSMTFQQSTLSTTDAFGSISSHSMLFLNICLVIFQKFCFDLVE